jgi:hypothetical protein
VEQRSHPFPEGDDLLTRVDRQDLAKSPQVYLTCPDFDPQLRRRLELVMNEERGVADGTEVAKALDSLSP